MTIVARDKERFWIFAADGDELHGLELTNGAADDLVRTIQSVKEVPIRRSSPSLDCDPASSVQTDSPEIDECAASRIEKLKIRSNKSGVNLDVDGSPEGIHIEWSVLPEVITEITRQDLTYANTSQGLNWLLRPR
ncbi:hypothetical protein [Corynebacterium pygosceleis]|uniref:hypothetical protein n=1 Tax=Corynebacterium pygosceleis TaxID=2800406 RepID=UPI0019066D03|nr:hypothetical protein [Corynebacterium pygosceleis]MCL0120655.1 hypothetical protein [Corynebacterium pygosceleis]